MLSSVTSNALVLSPGSIKKNERVEELIKCAQQQDPTKLTYIDDEDDRNDEGACTMRMVIMVIVV